MFCADLKKFQKLKEVPFLKQEDEEVKVKTKMKTSDMGKNKKTRITCDRKVKNKILVKKEEADK